MLFHGILPDRVGKMNRGLSVLHSFRLIKGREPTEEESFKANVLGWCVELVRWLIYLISLYVTISCKLSSWSLMTLWTVPKLVEVRSLIRQCNSFFYTLGQPCWYLVPGIGNMAINDSFILESMIYKTLKHYFRQDRYYVDLLELFHEVFQRFLP